MAKKILVIRFSSIGDIVLTTPVLRSLDQQLGAEVHFLTKTVFAPLVQFNPHVTKVICLQDEMADTIHELKSEAYDHIIDLHHNLRTKRIKYALGVPATSFYKLNFEKWMLVHLGINRLPETHIVDRYLATAESLGVINDERGLDFFIPDDQRVDIRQALQVEGEFLSIVTGAAHQTKCLTADQIAVLCDQIGKPIVLLGGKNESDKAEQIIKMTANNNVKNACGRFSILQSASILDQSASIVSHDTGLMHIAAALKKSQIVIWGNTIPQFGMYPYYGNEKIRWESFGQTTLKCRPCSKLGYAKCPKGHFKCILDHDMEKITEAVLQLM